MPLERIRLIFLGLGGIVLVAGCLWIATTPGPVGTRLVGAFGVLFFSAGIWATFRLAFKGQTRAETGRSSRTSKLILPLVLIFTLPWGLKLWFALPLLAGWLALVPHYRDRRALLAAAIFAAALSIAQAMLFSRRLRRDPGGAGRRRGRASGRLSGDGALARRRAVLARAQPPARTTVARRGSPPALRERSELLVDAPRAWSGEEGLRSP
jgi:hypothetical protein